MSALLEIERCPRRWALASASYPAIWARVGYPPLIQQSALIGHVVHLALARITRELAIAGCTGVNDPNTVPVMMRLGGFTGVVGEAIETIADSYRDNPRMSQLQKDSMLESLRSRLNSMRERVQSLLAQAAVRPHTRLKARDRQSKQRVVGGLEEGTHAEVDLAVPAAAWRGRADLILVMGPECEIVEFKAGGVKPEHEFQVRVYAWLLARDSKANPRGRRTTKLRIVYTDRAVELPGPSAAELETFEQELVGRAAAARRMAESGVPEARPSVDGCRNCGVRHLCDAYWEPSVQQRLAAEEQSCFGDVQLRVIGQHGPESWDAVVDGGAPALVGRTVVVRGRGNLSQVGFGARLRLLDARISALDETATSWVISPTASTERFLMQ